MGYPLGVYPVGIWAVPLEGILLGYPFGKQSPERQHALLCPRANKTSSASGCGWEGMASSSAHRGVFHGVLSDFHSQKQNQEQFREQNNTSLEQSEFPLLRCEANNVWVAAFLLLLLHLSKEASFLSRRQ